MNRKSTMLSLSLTLLAGTGLYLAVTSAPAVSANTGAMHNSEVDYTKQVAPLLQKYCQGCHSGAQARAGIDLKFKDEAHARAAALSDGDVLARVAREVGSHVMPPITTKNQPTQAERQLLVDWISKDALVGLPLDPGPFVVHRLNNREYANTIRDVLYLPKDYDPTEGFPADERGDGFDNNAETLTLSPILVERYLKSIEDAVDLAMTPPGGERNASNTTALGPNKVNDPSRKIKEDFADRQAPIRANMEVFLERAWRRLVAKEEVEEIMKFVAMGFAHEGGARHKPQALAMRAALMSTNFLIRTEMDAKADSAGAVFQLDEYQLASRLSYFLWATMPDDELFAAAREGRLRSRLQSEVTRMLKDPKAISLTKDFLGQWLEIRSLKDTPNASPETLALMQGETEAFFNYILHENRPLSEFLASDYIFVNEELARHYGIKGVTGPEFRKVSVDRGERGGIFTQASILTLTSKPLGTSRRTSPVVRGKWILENIFNQPIPPPPANVPSLAIDDGKELKGTVRQIFEQHRENPACAGCHARMDPYGFALENYDGFGKWRLLDNGLPVDASGDLAGRKFTTPVEFRGLLAARLDDFRRAVATKMLGYALGRSIQGYDRPSIDQIVEATRKNGDTFNALIMAVVNSYPFQNARGSKMVAGSGIKPFEAGNAVGRGARR